MLLDPEELAEEEPPIDVAALAVQEALASLLASQQSREALIWDDREVLVPHVWLVADLDSPETEGLAAWVESLYRRFRTLNVEARVLLLLRYMSWGKPDAANLLVHERCRLLVDRLAGETTPGRTNAMIYVVTDRDGVGNRYSDAESSGLVERALDVLMLADLAHGGDVGAERAFQAPAGGGPDGWETLPVFASMAGACLLWDAPAIARENAERRRVQLFEALASPAPAGYEPAPPDLQQIKLAESGSWPQLEVPTWSPRFRRTAMAEDARVTDLTATWLRLASDWRHAMLVTHLDRKDNLEFRAQSALSAYLRDLDGRERSVLDDSSLQGFFAPLHRLYDRATADLHVRHADASRAAGTHDGDERKTLDAVSLVKPPAEYMAKSDQKLIQALERKINPALLVQVTLMTIGITWLIAGTLANDIARFFANDAVVPEFPSPRTAESLGTWLQGVVDWAHGKAGAFIRGLVGLWNAPSRQEVWLWVGIVTVVSLVATAVFLALRQRVALERAWNVIYRRAGEWRNETMRALPADIKHSEVLLTEANIAAALEEIVRRRELLRAFEAEGRIAISDAPRPDDAVTGHIRPARATPPPISPLVVSRIVAVFKRRCGDLPTTNWEPKRLLDQLFTDAAEQAGDPTIGLRDEIPLFRKRVLTSMPPDGAVRVQQLGSTHRAEFAPLRVARFLGVPSGVKHEFVRDPERVTVVEIPLDDRFYTLVVQTGMSARRVLSLPPDDLDRSDIETSTDPGTDADGSETSAPPDDGSESAGPSDAIAASAAG